MADRRASHATKTYANIMNPRSLFLGFALGFVTAIAFVLYLVDSTPEPPGAGLAPVRIHQRPL